NDDSTFNAYIPINFTCSDTNVKYVMSLNDGEKVIESNDYIAVAENLNSATTYTIKYDVYYYDTDITYYLGSTSPTGSIDISCDLTNTKVNVDSVAETFEIVDFNYEMSLDVLVTYTDTTSEVVTLDSNNIGTYDINKVIDYVTISYSVKTVDDDILSANNITMIGNKYLEYNIDVDLYELQIDSISCKQVTSYEDSQDGTLEVTNNYLYIDSAKLIQDGYDIYLLQSENRFDPIADKVDGYFVFNIDSLATDTDFIIKVLDSSYNLVTVGNKVSYQILSSPGYTLPTYTFLNPNPGDCTLTYNDDSTFNAYIPVEFTCSDANLWYRIELNGKSFYDSKEFIAQIENIPSTEYYSLTYDVYYEYEGISYYITGETPSGGISGKVSKEEELYVDYSHINGTFSISNFIDVTAQDPLITYTDGTTATASFDNEKYYYTYDNSKIIDTITIYYCNKTVDESYFSNLGITLKGNYYNEYIFTLDEPYELIIDSISYGSEESSNYLYINANKVVTDGYIIYLRQNSIYYAKEVTADNCFIFDAKELSKDQSFDILVENSEGKDVVLLSSVTYTITSNIPEYAINEFSASDIMITYNDDSTFNAYIPINFTCSDINVKYVMSLNDGEKVIESNDYIAVAENLNSATTYTIKYNIYYTLDGITYLVETVNMIDSLSISVDLSNVSAEFDRDTSEIKLLNVSCDISSNLLVTYTDTTSEVVTLDFNNIGTYDNSKIIDYVTISYSIKAVDDNILEANNITMIGNKYLDYVVDVDAYELQIDSISYKQVTSYEYNPDGSGEVTTNYLYIDSAKLIQDGYDIYLLQSENRFDPIAGKVDGYFVFNIDSLAMDTDFIIKVLDSSDNLVTVGNKDTYQVLSSPGYTLPTYTFINPNPGDCTLTYNNDSTFNAYIPVKFTCSDANLWYRIELNDKLFYDSREYIAQIENIPSTEYYSLTYDLYYEYEGISYYIEGVTPSGTIDGRPSMINNLSVDYSQEDGTFNISNFVDVMAKDPLITYTDGTTASASFDENNYCYTFDNTKTIDTITIYYCNRTVDESYFSNLGITLKGSYYNEHTLKV
ncbi:MAG: hypothetical protein MR357_07990, partial [Anaeroplasma sp.]|nr:hypothetical protein [Anaeroplasma sp.]